MPFSGLSGRGGEFAALEAKRKRERGGDGGRSGFSFNEPSG